MNDMTITKMGPGSYSIHCTACSDFIGNCDELTYVGAIESMAEMHECKGDSHHDDEG